MLLKEYPELIRTFIQSGYQCSPFVDNPPRHGQFLLRHDVDFDMEAAEEMANCEILLGIRATYFFMLRSRFYNLYTPRNTNVVIAIRNVGHEISLHFDPSIYEEHQIQAGLNQELAIFQKLFGVSSKCISIHMPPKSLLGYEATPFNGIQHTYQWKYFGKIGYFSDSEGRFACPIHSPWFIEKRSIQLLVHPFWWTDK